MEEVEMDVGVGVGEENISDNKSIVFGAGAETCGGGEEIGGLWLLVGLLGILLEALPGLKSSLSSCEKSITRNSIK